MRVAHRGDRLAAPRRARRDCEAAVDRRRLWGWMTASQEPRVERRRLERLRQRAQEAILSTTNATLAGGNVTTAPAESVVRRSEPAA